MKIAKHWPVLATLATLATAIAFPIAGSAQEAQAPNRAASLAAFARIKQLAGTWQSQSTKGWSEQETFRVISNQHGVAVESNPPANALHDGTSPESSMLTVFYMDGDRLMLTHYCEAGNEPRMVATSIEDGGRTIHFSFVDAANLASPNAGHMHGAIFTFLDENHHSERWSWYQDGKEQWTETVQSERVNAATR